MAHKSQAPESKYPDKHKGGEQPDALLGHKPPGITSGRKYLTKHTHMDSGPPQGILTSGKKQGDSLKL